MAKKKTKKKKHFINIFLFSKPKKNTKAKAKSTKNASTNRKKKNTIVDTNISKDEQQENVFPDKFPFWARLKIAKHRPTLVIDEDIAYDKRKKKNVPGYVDREVTHTYRKDYEKIKPNPDVNDNKPMYLKRPTKKPKSLFEPHNKEWKVPDDLKKQYNKNNYKE